MDFNPSQKFTLLSKMGYDGPMDEKMMESFIQSNPAISSKMGQFQKALKRGFAQGGVVGSYTRTSGTPNMPTNQDTTTGNDIVGVTDVNSVSGGSNKKKKEKETTPTEPPKPIEDILSEASSQVKAAQSDPNKAINDFNTKGAEISAQITTLQNELANTTDKARKAEIQAKLDSLTNEYNTLSAASKTASDTLLAQNNKAQQDLVNKALTNPAELVQKAEVEKLTAEPGTIVSQNTGKVGEIAPITPTLVTETEKAVVPAEAETEVIDTTKVSDEVKRELEDLQAAKGTVSKEGTVKGQLEILMEDFEKDGTPPWASGAMRAAMATMQSRGLGASSMAGQAIVQAAMESAIAIASQDAATVAQFEMQNLNNEQQTLIFKTQQRVAGLFTDAAAENAAKQFNASSINQTKQFFAGLEESVSRFNAAQVNSIRELNANAENATKQFNTQLEDLRERFNATNSLVIAQANAQWRQNIATINTAAQNDANMEFAKITNGLTAAQLDNIWQRERDLMAFAFTSSESALDRNLELLMANKQIKANKNATEAELEAMDKAALGNIASKVLFGSSGDGGLFGGLFG